MGGGGYEGGVREIEGRVWVMGRGAWAFLVAGVLLGLDGCGPGRDPVDTPVAWWHHLQGGAIAEQRPPPPGVDAPYPHIGTTPARPAIPSVAARDALTASLIDQQAAAHQSDARNPIVVTGAVAPAKAGAAASAGTPGSGTGTPGAGQAGSGQAESGQGGANPPSSATLDAAGMPPAGAAGVPPPPPKPAPTPEQQEANEPVLAMPPPPPGTAIIASGGPLPQMPARPPAPPSFPGFDIPATTLPPPTPDLSKRAAALSNVAFQPGSDVLAPDAMGVLHRIAVTRGTSRVRVAAGGDARSDTPEAQEAALRLALARAATASEALEAQGVPTGAIDVAADAFGRGAVVSVVH